VSRLRSTIAALPAVVAVAVSLAVPALQAGGSDAVVGTAGSVTARAAQAGTTGGQDRFPVGSSAMEAAKATAAAYWGSQPCGGTYTLQWTPLDQGTNATASWRNPTDAWANAGKNFDCRIDINPAADFDYPKLCTVLTHEIGHLLGQQHDPNPGQLMSAYYTSAIPQCMTAEPASTADVAPGTDNADYAESDWGVAATDKPKQSLRRKTTKTTKSVKRCKTVKNRHGKRVKKCTTVKAKKAATTAEKRKR
jgi:hypothetical protein